MSDTALGKAVHGLHSRIIATQAGDTPDRLLMEMLRSNQREAAFEALVRRYGPMVMGVCRRMLGNAHDAEDAFQATFLVFAEKVTTIRQADRVASWLHKTAYFTAKRLRASLQRRAWFQWRLKENSPPAGIDESDSAEWREVCAILDQEVQKLPEKYRSPIVMCYLEGRTIEYVAKQMGCPAGTISSRLARGKEMLHRRLVNRGVTLSAAALATLIVQKAASAAPGVEIIRTTAGAAALLLTGQTITTGLVSAKILALKGGVIQTMMMTKYKIAAVVMLGVAVSGGGVGIAARTGVGFGEMPNGVTSHRKEQNDQKSSEIDQDIQEFLKAVQGEWQFERASKIGVEQLYDPVTRPAAMPRPILKIDGNEITVEDDKISANYSRKAKFQLEKPTAGPFAKFPNLIVRGRVLYIDLVDQEREKTWYGQIALTKAVAWN